MFKPLSNRVLVAPNVEAKTTSTGLYLPENSTSNPVRHGIVAAVGGGAVTMSGDIIPMEVKVGDTVCYMGRGIEIDVAGQNHLLFIETDLLGILS